jgi:hypothetical protein
MSETTYQLDKINITACPDCGCKRIRKAVKENQHTNGHWNESVEFTCGFTIAFSPNFVSHGVHESKPCEDTIEHKEKLSKRRAFKTKLKAYIKRSSIDEDFKKSVLRTFEYI